MQNIIRKLNWNVVLTAISAIAAIISIFIAVAANSQSEYSLKLAEEANEIAEQGDGAEEREEVAQ